MTLTDTQIRNAKPADKPIRMFDGGGLFMMIVPAGGKWWRFKYRFGGKEKQLSMGTYPEVSLKDAREKRDAARKQVASGIDPGEHRKAAKSASANRAENSFEVVAREWFAKFEPTWAPSHADKVIRRLEKDVFPCIGARPIAEITALDLLPVLRRIEERGALDTAHRAGQNCGQVFRYAIATGRAERNPAADLRGALPPAQGSHYAAITEPKEIGALLRAIDAYEGFYSVRYALRLAPLVFLRPGELRLGEWAEIDLDNTEWMIPAARMKLREPHLVPLSRQAVEILRELHAVTGERRYLFPGGRTHLRPMSNNALLAALRRMGYTKEEMTPHGFRAMARTVLDEVLGFRPDIIEHQLAHAVRDPLGRAYNRTKHLPERRKMMQEWADYLDKLKAGGEIVPLHGKVAG